jgi:uncharacterized protein (TIGR02118 family)
MITVISTARRKPDLSMEDLRRKMREEHAPLVARFPGLGNYTMHFALDGMPSPWDVVVELTFPDVQSFRAALASSAGQEALAHMRELVEMSTVLSGVFEGGAAA